MSFAADLIATEERQHQLLGVKLQGLREFHQAQRQAVFDDLRRYLAAHVAAEQVWADQSTSPRPTQTQDLSHSSPTEPESAPDETADHIARVIAAMEAVPVDGNDFDAGRERLAELMGIHGHLLQRRIDSLLRVGGESAAEDLLFAMNAVPMMSRGEGHEVERPEHFTYRDLFEVFFASFQVMPRPGR